MNIYTSQRIPFISSCVYHPCIHGFLNFAELMPDVLFGSDSPEIFNWCPVSINAFLQPRDRNVCIFLSKVDWIILPETNITSENRPSQKEDHLPIINFQGRTVSFRECIYGHAYRIKPPNVSYIVIELPKLQFSFCFVVLLETGLPDFILRIQGRLHAQLWMQYITCQPSPI